ncbi:MAG: hypothetical protein Q4D31_02425 [Eubacteriales bacterium]|nr:hypothetical protein [Eubacteriales bacterium]
MYISKKTMTIVAVVLILLIVGGALAFHAIFGQSPAAPVADTRDKLKIDPAAGEYVAPETTPTESTGIAIPGWGSMTIPAGQTEVAVDLPNPEANAGKYYLTFELRLKDSGEVLYTSGLVPPGQTIQHITLNRPLTAGEYAAVVHVQPYEMDEAQTPTNNADMETTLIVAN